jgi:hypothetical protein
MKEDVRAAKDNRHAATAEFIGDVVGTKRSERAGGDRNDVGALLEIQRLELLVNKLYLPVRRRQSRQVGEG